MKSRLEDTKLTFFIDDKEVTEAMISINLNLIGHGDSIQHKIIGESRFRSRPLLPLVSPRWNFTPRYFNEVIIKLDTTTTKVGYEEILNHRSDEHALYRCLRMYSKRIFNKLGVEDYETIKRNSLLDPLFTPEEDEIWWLLTRAENYLSTKRIHKITDLLEEKYGKRLVK
jgi:hypothetical protein